MSKSLKGAESLHTDQHDANVISAVHCFYQPYQTDH